MTTTALAFRLTVEGGVASFVLEERADFGPAREVVVLALLLGLSTIGQAMSGKELEGRIEVALEVEAERVEQLVILDAKAPGQLDQVHQVRAGETLRVIHPL